MIWFLFLSGSGITTYSLFSFYLGYRSKHWPYSIGKVVHSCVIVKMNHASSSKTKHYHPVVSYEYEVGEKKYKSHKIGNYLGFDSDKDLAEKLINDYPVKSEVKVFYCPGTPALSVLLPGMKQLAVHSVLLFLGVILMLGSAPVLFSDNPFWFVDKVWQVIDIFI